MLVLFPDAYPPVGIQTAKTTLCVSMQARDVLDLHGVGVGRKQLLLWLSLAVYPAMGGPARPLHYTHCWAGAKTEES